MESIHNVMLRFLNNEDWNFVSLQSLEDIITFLLLDAAFSGNGEVGTALDECIASVGMMNGIL